MARGIRNNTKTRHLVLGDKGAEDLVTTAMATHPSRLIYSLNVERNISGGFARIPGYTLFDGSEAPAAVPGTGSILGGAIFNGDVYVMRNGGSPAVAKLYKATASGWTLVHTFANAGVRAEFVVENFLGSASGFCLYGCDGGNKAFQVTTAGTVSLITSGATTDTPTHIEAHKTRLWLGFSDGAVRYSPVGEPAGVWADLWTAGVIGIGRAVTGFKSVKGGTLVIFGEDRTYLLEGSISGTSGDMVLKEHSQEVGAWPWTIQEMMDVLFMDRIGVTSLVATQDFGDFALGTRSMDIRPLIEKHKANVKASVVLKDRQQYRVYCRVNYGTLVLIGAVLSSDRIDWTRAVYPAYVTSAWAGEISGQPGLERSFCGDESGNVYEMDVGTSFNGDAYRSVWVLPFDHQGEPSSYKTYRKAMLEVDSPEQVDFKYQATFDYEAPGIPRHIILDAAIDPEGARWGDIDEWGDFTWGAAIQGTTYGYLAGFAKCISLTITHNSDTSPPFTLRAVSYLFEPRRLEH